MAFLVAGLLVGLLPAGVLAAGPSAFNDHPSVPVDAPATALPVLLNDSGASITTESSTAPVHGTVVIAGDGLGLTYQPDATFHGTDTFDYVRDFAWVATRTPTSGSAQVWIDGVLAATINLRSTSTTYRQLVFQRHFSTLATHTIEIRPMGTGRIHLDAFLFYR
jgi:hypothetical protein